jgi:ribosomal protein S27AE
MADDVVTLVRCGRCGQDGTLSVQGDRFWCAWCGDWAAVEARQVGNALVSVRGGVALLVSAPPARVPLQPLRVPAGWAVEHNNGLYELDPSPELVPEQDRWWLFKEDMLQLRHGRRDRLLDLGWYPEGDLVQGHYGLVVYEGDFRGRLLHESSTRDRPALVAEIERLLQAVADGRL